MCIKQNRSIQFYAENIYKTQIFKGIANSGHSGEDKSCRVGQNFHAVRKMLAADISEKDKKHPAFRDVFGEVLQK